MVSLNARAEMKEIASERSQGYAFFADMFFGEANELFIERLGGSAAEGAECTFSQVFDGRSNAEIAADARSEYASLFLAMSASPVFTSESVYLSGNHCLMQESRDEVLCAYRAEGFDVAGNFRQPEDHIAVELAFMSQLCTRLADAAETDDEAAVASCLAKQRAFLESHLVLWVPKFCQCVREHPRVSFYRPVADLLEEFVEREAALLEG